MIVGLTGGIATGKSAVATILHALGATVIDADQVARDIVLPNTEALAEIVKTFGSDMLHPDGTLHRERMGEVVFQDAGARKQLEAITHPRIRFEIARRVQEAALAGAPAIFVEAALLVETGSAALYPDLWVVICEEDTQIARLQARKGCDDITAKKWISAQMPLQEKAAHATELIQNDGSLEDLQARVETAYSKLMEQQPGPE